jgi:hypothetical protein
LRVGRGTRPWTFTTGETVGVLKVVGELEGVLMSDCVRIGRVYIGRGWSWGDIRKARHLSLHITLSSPRQGKGICIPPSLNFGIFRPPFMRMHTKYQVLSHTRSQSPDEKVLVLIEQRQYLQRSASCLSRFSACFTNHLGSKHRDVPWVCLRSDILVVPSRFKCDNGSSDPVSFTPRVR